MACWYFCSLCRDGAERNSAADLLEHIMKAHKCSGWSKYNGHPKKKCLIKFHFDIMNPQERICNSLKPVNITCSFCKVHHNFSVDYVTCVQNQVLIDQQTATACDFPTQDDPFLIDAVNTIETTMVNNAEGEQLAVNNEVEDPLSLFIDEMSTQDDLMLDKHAALIEEMIVTESHETVQQLLNGKYFKDFKLL